MTSRVTSWLHAFDPEATRDARFVTLDGQSVRVPTMHAGATFGYAEQDGLKALELPYVGGQLSMVLLLPSQEEGLAGLEARISPTALGEILGALAPAEVDVALPRFKVDPPESFSLAKALTHMGMKLAFDPGKADFGGMSDRRLFVDDIFHKAFVEVNEEGTEAAAATAVVMAEEEARARPAFQADRPFLFLIRDKTDGALLFLGRVADPRA